ncbi:hypothetical protein BLA18112_05870 [Burkholderia lata]|uniref:Uncharacterized protein n=1 Tax=Burkholderia lata (strain ATCC 17760 / DSM 23089 / LMG 22485 / NCIMB 9086 / R18194 / 383) TaxID=482957 RepID=A0A6P2Z6T3_BURL3|nr:hypothetical protein BLA18112_05870 [Burkholderia lata]
MKSLNERRQGETRIRQEQQTGAGAESGKSWTLRTLSALNSTRCFLSIMRCLPPCRFIAIMRRWGRWNGMVLIADAAM